MYEFQSTHLSRGATPSENTGSDCSWHFNPRTSHEVRRRILLFSGLFAQISIHAPLTRCDGLIGTSSSAAADFNPRTSHEVRLLGALKNLKCVGFQSTHLSRGATDVNDNLFAVFIFQSTHLSRGATCIGLELRYSYENFNPRTSHEVRQNYPAKDERVGSISIHAPLTRCDTS